MFGNMCTGKQTRNARKSKPYVYTFDDLSFLLLAEVKDDDVVVVDVAVDELFVVCCEGEFVNLELNFLSQL